MANSENRVTEGVVTQAGAPRSGAGVAQSNPEVPRIPQGGYEVLPSKRIEPETGFMSGQYSSAEVVGDAAEDNGVAMIVRGRLSDASKERQIKKEQSQTKKYAAIGIGLGLAVGLAVAFLMRHPGGGISDMGAVNAAQYGLTGHLTTDWKDNRLAYRLTIEPAAQAQRTGFQENVNSSPRPLSLILQAKDPFGAVLCSDTILVKYDPHYAPSVATKELKPNASRAEQALAARNEIAKGITLARLEGQELDREHGKTLFQNDVGADGQVASITAQGVLPCAKKDVDQFASWSFLSDFPIVAKPVVSKGGAPDRSSNADTSTADDDAKKSEEVAVAAKARKKPVPPPVPPIFVEGDDQIAWFDATGGVAETRGGKALMLDKGDNLVASLKGRDLPIAIHYRCNEMAGCTFSGVGLGLHHARLRQ